MHRVHELILMENREVGGGHMLSFQTQPVHWKPAQIEAASLKSPGSNFSVYAVALETVDLLAKPYQK